MKKRIISALLLLSAVSGICKAEKIVSATDMKIVGDGITMNTEAIQKAIDYCIHRRMEDVLYLQKASIRQEPSFLNQMSH